MKPELIPDAGSRRTKPRLMLAILLASTGGVTVHTIFEVLRNPDSVAQAECINPHEGTDSAGNPAIVCDPPTGGGGGGSSDSDKDGVKNSADVCPDTAVGEVVDANGCSANQRDDDGDGVLGGVEVFLGSDPSKPDTDGDGLTDGEEIYESDGITVKAVLDADGDGTLNVLESNIDTDGDGLSPATGDDDETDACVPDTTVDACDQDDDGLTNAEETDAGSDPTNPDTDGDGVPDDSDQDNTTPSGALVDTNGVAVTTTTVAATTTTVAVSKDDDDSSTAAIAVIAAVGGLLLVGLTVFLVRRRRTPEAD